MAEPSGDDVASTATIEAPIPDVQPDAVDAGVVIDSMTDVKAPTNSTDAKEAAEVAEVATDATPDEAAPEPAPPVEASEDVDAVSANKSAFALNVLLYFFSFIVNVTSVDFFLIVAI